MATAQDQAVQPQNQNTMLAIKESTVDAVLSKIQKYQAKGELELPPNYSAANALKSAWLMIQETVDRDKRPALTVCTRESVANSLLSMVLQGLNPDKKQVYFLVYGKKLVAQRSYFGTMAVLKQVDPTVDDIVAEVIYDGDKFSYKLLRGKKVITEHEQSIDNVDKAKIKGAYCVIYDFDGNVKHTDIMTMAEIYQSWKQSRQSPFDEGGNVKAGSVHGKFTADMCKRTVINRACKMLINRSDDGNIIVRTFRQSEDERNEADADEVLADNANQGPIIDIEPEPKDERSADQGSVDEQVIDVPTTKAASNGSAQSPQPEF